ncbi:MAG: CXXX repeat peptide modification system protein [Dorea sp.]|jgi:CXXX repeat modification system protein|nr:CXXX repeat peptide modification system protein [Dorea sp.]
MVRVGKVTVEERDEIRNIYEKINALRNLQLIVEEENLYKKVEKDLQNVEKEFDEWWGEKARKYQWKSKDDASWIIDFSSNDIFLTTK